MKINIQIALYFEKFNFGVRKNVLGFQVFSKTLNIKHKNAFQSQIKNLKNLNDESLVIKWLTKWNSQLKKLGE